MKTLTHEEYQNGLNEHKKEGRLYGFCVAILFIAQAGYLYLFLDSNSYWFLIVALCLVPSIIKWTKIWWINQYKTEYSDNSL